jgi:hypothetical protein
MEEIERGKKEGRERKKTERGERERRKVAERKRCTFVRMISYNTFLFLFF